MALSIHNNFDDICKSKRIQNCCSISYPTYHLPYEEPEAQRAKMTFPRSCTESCGRSRMKQKGTKHGAHSYSLETLSHLAQLPASLEVASPNIHVWQHPPIFLQSSQYIMRNSVMSSWMPELTNVRSAWFPVATGNCRINPKDLHILTITKYYLWTK